MENSSSRNLSDEEYETWLARIETNAAEITENATSEPIHIRIAECYMSESSLQDILIKAGFDLTNPIQRVPNYAMDAIDFYGTRMTDKQERAELLDYQDFFYIIRRNQGQVGGAISRHDLHELLTSRGMLGTDPVPRADDANPFDFSKLIWSGDRIRLSDEDRDYRRSPWED